MVVQFAALFTLGALAAGCENGGLTTAIFFFFMFCYFLQMMNKSIVQSVFKVETTVCRSLPVTKCMRPAEESGMLRSHVIPGLPLGT